MGDVLTQLALSEARPIPRVEFPLHCGISSGQGQQHDRPRKSAIAYVAARLPTLSETFVYRELMGLQGGGAPSCR